MPLGFLSSSSSPFDEIVDRATADTLSNENWDLILSINDKVTVGGSKAAKDCLLSIKKRLNHRDPHVVLLALSLVDSCMSNCGTSFQQEACSKEFLSELRSKATGSNKAIADKTCGLIKKWLDENKALSSSLLNNLYTELKRDGVDFPATDTNKATATKIAALENALREEEELNKAIQLSLNEQKSKPTTAQMSGSSSFSSALYPSAGGGASSNLKSSFTTTTTPTLQQSPSRSVKALYDFEAAEDNELTFKAGDIITVLDDSDANWWKGSTAKSDGLFPASFVSADLNVDVEQLNAMEKRKSVQFDDNVKIETVESKSPDEPLVIDEEKLSKCLDLLQNADPTGEREDPSELLHLEEQCLRMGPLIDAELNNYDRQMNQLSEINCKLMDGLNLYHSAMNPTVPTPLQYMPQHSMNPTSPGHPMMGPIMYGQQQFVNQAAQMNPNPQQQQPTASVMYPGS